MPSSCGSARRFAAALGPSEDNEAASASLAPRPRPITLSPLILAPDSHRPSNLPEVHAHQRRPHCLLANYERAHVADDGRRT